MVDSCTAIVQQNQESLDSIKSKLNCLSVEVASFCSKLGKAAQVPLPQFIPESASPLQSKSNILDLGSPTPVLHSNILRKEHLVVFGVKEQSMTDTKETAGP